MPGLILIIDQELLHYFIPANYGIYRSVITFNDGGVINAWTYIDYWPGVITLFYTG